MSPSVPPLACINVRRNYALDKPGTVKATSWLTPIMSFAALCCLVALIAIQPLNLARDISLEVEPKIRAPVSSESIFVEDLTPHIEGFPIGQFSGLSNLLPSGHIHVFQCVFCP